MALPSVGRAASPVRPAMARYLDLPGGCAPPSTWRYIHPAPSRRVGRNPAVGGGEGPYTVFIYTYTCRAVSTWRWDISPGGGSPPFCRRPSRYSPGLSLSPIGAPRWGSTPAARRTGPPPTGQRPRLAPSLMTAPGNAPRAWPTANWRVSPATIARAPSPPLLSFVRSRARPQSSHLPRPTGPPSHPLDPLDPPSPSAPGAALLGPRPPAPTPTPTPACSGLLLYGGPGGTGACADGVAACNGSRPAASPSSYDPRRAAP